MSPNDPRHGTSAGYDAHRRNGETACDPCRDAACRYEKGARFDRLRGRPRTLPAVGTARRLQALVAMGYTLGEIAAECDTSWDMVQKWTHREGIVRRDTADHVRRVFDRLCMTPPPETTGKEKWRRSYARTVAKKNGWLPPLAWDDIDRDPEPPTAEPVYLDEVVVDRILAGDRLDATPAERAEVVRRWLNTGRPLADLERLTGWNGAREKSRSAFSMHHRQPRGMGGSSVEAINTAPNLLLVCGSGTTGCHGLIESQRAISKANGWLVPHPTNPADVPVLIFAGVRVYLTPDGRYQETH